MNTSTVYDVMASTYNPMATTMNRSIEQCARDKVMTSQSQCGDVANVGGRARLAGVVVFGVWRAGTPLTVGAEMLLCLR